MYRLAIILSVLLSAHSAYAGDVRLDKPVTLAVKGEALSDIIPIVEKQTGVHLRVAHDIADQKATIFVDDKPLKEIMSGLAKLFEYQWSYQEIKGVRSYDLSMSGKVRRARESRRDKAIGQAWKDFDADVKRVAEMPVRSREELDRLFDQTEFDQTVSDDDSLPGMYKVDGYDMERRKKAVAHLYLTFSPSLRKALRDGMTICWDLDSPEPEWKIPTALEKEFRDGTVYYYVVPNDPDKRTKKDFGTLTVELSASTTADKFRVEVYEQFGKPPDTMGYVFAVYEKLLSRLVAPPEKSLPRKEDDPILDSKISYTAKELEEEAALPKSLEPWREEIYINRSDLLALLHKKLGLQIISDHYSHWYSWQPADKCSVKSILESLERFPGAMPGELKNLAKSDEWYLTYLTDEHPAAEWGWDGKLLYMRAANPSTMDAREIPNTLIHRWQAVSKAGLLGLTEVAEIHTLTEKQLEMLSNNFQRLGIEWAQHNVGAAGRALRLYGLLSPGQRKLMLDGRLSTQAFTTEQRAALLSLIPKGMNPAVRKGRRVGIYDAAGLRVDKPDPDSSAYPESVRLEAKQQIEGFTIGERQVARTLEETLREVKTESERAALRKFVSTEYEMILTYADGTESKKWFSIWAYKPVQLPASPEKSGAAEEENRP